VDCAKERCEPPEYASGQVRQKGRHTSDLIIRRTKGDGDQQTNSKQTSRETMATEIGPSTEDKKTHPTNGIPFRKLRRSIKKTLK